MPLSPATSPLPRVRYTFSCEAAPAIVWRVRRFALVEALSQPYELMLDLLVDALELDVDSLLATGGEFSLDRDGLVRTVCGVIARVELGDPLEDQQPVRLVLVPALRLLEQRVDTRLWQDRSALAVVEEVLRPALADYGRELDVSRLTGRYAARELVVQYRESDLDFCARLLEDEGIAYHFDHERGTGREVLVLEDSADHVGEVPTLDDEAALPVIVDRAEQADVESLSRLMRDRAVRPTAVVRRTFDWLTSYDPVSAELVDDAAAGPRREVYQHGRVVEVDPQPRVARELAHAREGSQALRGVGNVTGLAPWRRFRVDAVDRPELDEFLVTRVLSRGDCPEVALGEAQGADEYVNEFECVLFDGAPWRPPLRTRAPTIPGPLTAIVTGPEGEEIHTDEHGRVKVRFDWDRQHALTDDTSAWIRVAHGWAGAGFGVQFIPRVGMEVVVEFLGGDPARPLVTGCVHNGKALSSLALPEAKTQSTIRTASSPGGDGFNELRFEDAAGAEEIFVHAQRDLREVIGRDRSTTIGHDHGETIGHDHRQTVRGAQTCVVDGARTDTVRGDETRVRERSRATTIGGDDRLEVRGHTAAVHRDSLERHVTGVLETRVLAGGSGPARANTEVEGDLDAQIRNTAKTTVGDRLEVAVGSTNASARAEFADGTLELEATDTWRAKAGADASLEGCKSAELRQGAASIRLEDEAVVIDAREIRLVVGGNTLVLSEQGLRTETTTFDVAAEGPITITGASVTID